MNGSNADYLQRSIHWVYTGDPFFPYRSIVDNQIWEIRLNDFPDEIMYTLFIDGQEITSFDNWPRSWARPYTRPAKMGLIFLRVKARNKNTISREEAIRISKQACEDRNWPWRYPVVSGYGQKNWVLHILPAGSKPKYQIEIVINAKSGKILKAKRCP